MIWKDIDMVRTQHTPALVVRLLFWYLVTLVGLWLLQVILVVLSSMEMSAGGLAPTILAAMIPGDIYFRRTRQLPSKGFGWRMAISFALSGLCVTVLQAALLIRFGNAHTLEVASNFQFLALMLFLHIIIIGPLKWCFGWGASSRQCAVEKKAVKALAAEQQKSST